jgi:hypothetical protein
MGISICWDNDEKTRLRIDLEGEWTWDDYQVAADEFITMITSVTHPVDFISFLHPDSSVPQGPVLRHYRNLLKRLPKNFGMAVLVGGTVIERSLATMAYKIYQDLNGRIFFAASLAEARQMLVEQRVPSGTD